MGIGRQKPLRRLVIVAVVVMFGVGAIRLLDGASLIQYYRVVDEQTLVVGTISGVGATVRVTDLEETSTTVTITVRSFHVQLGPGNAGGSAHESVATLQESVGARTVIDGSSGLPIQRAACPPPAVFAAVCP
jgi:hypothetical protein